MAKKENSFSGWLQRVRRTGEFSDVTVVVEGQEFQLHMLPLLNASVYFRNLPGTSSPFMAGNSRIVEIRDMPGGAEGFSAAADFCYLIKPTYTLDNVAKIRAVAEHLGMVELQDSTKKFLYMNIFSHWRSSIAFLQQYQRLNSPVDQYIESRCLKVISAACIKAFFDTKYLSAPIPLSATGSNTWQSSPCQVLTDTLVRVSSLPDEYVQEVIEELVNGEVNLNLKCRQGRNVKSWLDHTITTECRTDRSRCWVVICLTRMLEKSVTMDRPWLELSSQYWCGLLEHVQGLMKAADAYMLRNLQQAKSFLEERIGGSLHELDDYLLTYNFEPQTLLDLVNHFKQMEVSEKEMEEVATEVDSCLWSFVDTACISAEDFISFIEAFPETSRTSHDMLCTAIEKLIMKGEYEDEEKQRLWGLVNITKLSPTHREKALSNPIFLCQPHVLEYVLRQHNEELEEMGDEDRHKLKEIMQKVVRASLKLLEENSRRTKEIMELQKQYAYLIGNGKPLYLQDSCESSPDIIFNKSRMNGCVHAVIPDEVEDEQSDSPARRSTCSSLEY
ncbi:hypothetical protein KP509_12G087900 [Ceratopteris richardii]|uniref:Uncharacterized protein n=1 Tax=Ceratopteris richardii TaxID=49495 RepID=A0A8T2TRM3_CERRI|nr:hypothetical protein KP509_12G087900 [Ceratopteris richardii]KAH7424060.1 hypothetical protein KP509_12G087900 [Ceratopteris richardii]KAH7424061.1 hypothetical protein KP509_12G087900 [Ceratopteris richardii]KAH7424062.1 hypothetical protein KP509_12G087900 [Ceratopteris richardii]KAH7424063.1 hypothetical protein KP509_12G087900 [Ceratopteris richardii]